EVPGAVDPLRTVEEALAAPMAFRWEDWAGVRKVAVAVNDKTRPVPHDVLLPPLLRRLEGLGVPPERITLFIANGTHAPMTPDEYDKVLPPGVLGRYPVMSHDSDRMEDLLYLGETRRGTPVWVNRAYAEADLRVVVGNIEPHQFAGFSGGVKTVVVGLGARQGIDKNHALMMQPGAEMGRYQGNPLREDIEEAGERIGVHLALNAIINTHGEVVQVLAGAPRAVMEAGVPISQEICMLAVPQAYDLVISSAGGYPKDINLYQSQKGLRHAVQVVRDGGVLILVSACVEGTGSRSWEAFMEGITSVDEALERFAREPFRVGPHKAFLIAQDLRRATVYLVSELDPGLARRLLFRPAPSVQAALDEVLPSLPEGARVAILPKATSTVPRVLGAEA
ncbi:MAG: nickel-dependent lactate racemase, partial [Anaerolineae bacterium]|nr:nickel-dependent lactate racemase [Anaerolineae bacterium]